MRTPYPNELYHHGIPGQKWGKRNGPPYPLNESDKSSAEKQKEHKGLSDKAKRNIKITAISFVATAAIAGGTYYAYTHRAEFKAIFGNGRNFVDSYLENEDEHIFSLEPNDKIKKLSAETGLKLKKVKTTALEDCRQANPNNIFGTSEYENNCIPSSIAFVFRRMGLDVSALPIHPDKLDGGFNNNEMGKTFSDLLRWNINRPEIDKSSAKTVVQSIKSSISDLCDGEDGLGLFTVRDNMSGFGHAMAWEKRGSKISLYDPLIGTKVNNGYFKRIAKGEYGDILSVRLDDLPINAKALTEFFVQNSR